jgi:N-acetylmuramoyl-L-alanine amidase
MEKRTLTIIIYFVLLIQMISIARSEYDFISAVPQKGDSIKELLERYELEANEYYRDIFIRLNKDKLSNDNSLFLSNDYYLPICRFQYNGKSIRSTLGIDDYAKAKEIEFFNERMLAFGLQSKHFRYSKELWVPVGYIPDFDNNISEQNGQQVYDIFGKDHSNVDIIDKVLEGHVFYIVSGHGGPDPGAVGNINGATVCEDEYAYDVSLRLARRLLEHSAKVYVIVRDSTDGIRDENILDCDKDEYYLGGDSIDVDQVTRLKQRADIVNRLYEENKANAKAQKAIMLHVDSRFPDKRIDVFFYHHENSSSGKSTAEEIYNTFLTKYDLNQPGRGYLGSVSSRNLYMLRHTLPVAVYVELGNIQNERDQIRFTKVNNRQALANWLCEALIKAKDK